MGPQMHLWAILSNSPNLRPLLCEPASAAVPHPHKTNQKDLSITTQMRKVSHALVFIFFGESVATNLSIEESSFLLSSAFSRIHLYFGES